MSKKSAKMDLDVYAVAAAYIARGVAMYEKDALPHPQRPRMPWTDCMGQDHWHFQTIPQWAEYTARKYARADAAGLLESTAGVFWYEVAEPFGRSLAAEDRDPLAVFRALVLEWAGPENREAAESIFNLL